MTFLLWVRTSTNATATKLSLPPEIVIFVFKVIPLFCTAHPLLCIILWHPVPASTKRTNKGHFCRAKAFIRNNNAADRLTASWFAIEKQENERNDRDSEVCSGFSLRGSRVVELLSVLALRLWMGAVKSVWQLYGSAIALTSHYLAWDRYCTYVVQTPGVKRRIFLGQIRPTRTTRGRPIFDVSTKFAAEYTFRLTYLIPWYLLYFFQVRISVLAISNT